MWRYLLRRLPRGQAEDAFAETYAQAWTSVTRHRPPAAGRELPWLYGIARHVVARFAADTRGRALPPSEPTAAADGAGRRLAALRELTGAEREAVILVAWEGLSYAQAARAAGCTRAALAVRLHRARQRLAGHLDQRVRVGTPQEVSHDID